MKKILFILIVFCYSVAFGQRIPGKIQDPIINNQIKGPNLLDDPRYKRDPIKFVPLQPDSRRGYDPDKIYELRDDNGRIYGRAKGSEIVRQVNELEKSLNERGHSLRNKDAFAGLSLKIDKVAYNDISKCVIKKSNPDWNNVRIRQLFQAVDLDSRNEPVVLAYTGEVRFKGEFRQIALYDKSSFSGKNKSIDVGISLLMNPTAYEAIAKCQIVVYAKSNSSKIAYQMFDVKYPYESGTASSGEAQYSSISSPRPKASKFTIRYYRIKLDNNENRIPAPEPCKTEEYTVQLNFYDAAGKIVNTTQHNKLTFINEEINFRFPKTVSRIYQGFNYELLDPGLHAFGFYANSTGFSASNQFEPLGCQGEKWESSINANMSIGVKTYNFERLINSNAPLSKSLDLFSYNISSKEQNTKADNTAPEIRIPGGGLKAEDPDYGTVTVLGKTFNLNETSLTSFTDGVGADVVNQSFFIGPIPCNVRVSFSGNVSVSTSYISDGKTTIKSTITPHADVNIHASGGIQVSSIAYAKVFSNINLLSVDMPIVLEVSKNDAKVDPSITVGGLSGEIYFQAGICIPIPFVDDLCKSFRIDIFSWDGLKKTYKINPESGLEL